MTSKIAEAGARRAAAKLRWLYGMPEREDATIFAEDVLLSQSGLGRAVEALEKIKEYLDDAADFNAQSAWREAFTALHHIEHGHD